MRLAIYHGGCTDGVAAAWALWSSSNNADRGWHFFPGVYQQEPPWDFIDDANEVRFLDFSYKRPVVEAIFERTRRPVSIIDHHRSAIEDLEPITSAGGWYRPSRLDENRCGAYLTWQTFHPGAEPPELLRYIDHRDRFDLDGAPNDLDEVIIALRAEPHEPAADGYQARFERWTYLMTDEGIRLLRADGKAMYRYYSQRVEEYVAAVIGGCAAWRFVRDGEEIAIGQFANVPFNFASDVGNELARLGTGLGGCYWHSPNGVDVTFSLRSCGDADGASRRLAEAFGGGGHPNAAGFKVAADSIRWADSIVEVPR